MVLGVRERLIERRQMEAQASPAEAVAEHAGRRAIMQTETYVTGANLCSVLIKRHRTDRKLSQARLADRLACDHTYISRMESGGRRPSPEFIRHFADVLGLTALQRNQLLAAQGGMDGPLLTEDEHARFADSDANAVWILLKDETRSTAFRSSLRAFLAAWQSTPKG